MEHLSAVQGKDRKEVEQGPEKTDVNEDDQKIAAVLIDRRRDFHDSEDEEAKQDLDGWTRGGDEETLFAIQPDAAEGRISAEGLQDDATVGAEGSRGECVAEFVGENRDEAGDDEEENFKNRFRTVRARRPAKDD